jgi:hypothetical protein
MTRFVIRDAAIVAAVAIVAFTLSAPRPGAAQPVQAGVSSAVSGEVERASPAAQRAKAPLAVGDDILMQDRIGVGAQSVAQLLLLDETAFTIGPDSEVVIDEFVYDPATGNGRLAASALKGTFRFVSGKIGALSPENIALKTPTAVIGVRGTMLIVDIVRNAQGAVVEELVVLTGPGARNNARQKPGRIKVTANGVTVPISRTGWGTFVRPGQDPTPAAPIPLETIMRLSDLLTASVVSRTSAADAAAKIAVGAASASSLAGQGVAEATARGDAVQEEAAGTDYFGSQIASNEIDSSGGLFSGSIFPFTLTTIEALKSVSTGIATFGPVIVPLFDFGSLSDIGLDSNNNLSSISGSSVGSYTFAATVNLGMQTFTVGFTAINAPTLGFPGIGNSITQIDTYSSDSGFAFTFFDETDVGTGIGVTALGACVTIGCSAGAVLLTDSAGDPTAAVIHSLGLGSDLDTFGGGFVGKN